MPINSNDEAIFHLLKSLPDEFRDDFADMEISEISELTPFYKNELTAMLLFYACRTPASYIRFAPVIEKLTLNSCVIHSLVQLVDIEAFAEASALLNEVAKNAATIRARRAATARHNRPDSRKMEVEAARTELLKIWLSGKYSSRDVCAEQESAALNISFSTARKFLRGK